MGSLNDQLVKHIDEAIAMEENVKRMLDGMIQTSDDPGVIDLLEQHKVETEQHSQRLRERLKAHGASSSMVREATGILGALAKLPLDMVRGEKAGRNARDGYATEHMEIAAYQLLEQVATRAGDEETAEVARLNRADEEAMAKKLDEQWDHFAELSLREEARWSEGDLPRRAGAGNLTVGDSRHEPRVARLKQGCRRRNHARTPDGACWRSP